ncbi:MAG: tetratricopeptide repeat protein, partial [Bradymonadaceae bacterium]
ERVKKGSERLEKEEKKKPSIRKGPRAREAVAGKGRSPEEIERIKRRLERKNREMIEKLDNLIENDPHNPNKPDWMFQKAELKWELTKMEYLRKRAKYNQCLKSVRKGTAKKSECKEPTADYSEALKIYKEILQQSPGYARIDEVIYRLGRGLLEAGKGAQAVSYLQRLVKNYPKSKYIPDANLELAEYFFKQQLLGAARDKYKAVLEYKDHPDYDYALYKLGWVYYNRNKFRKSVETFKRVVERTNKKLGFQKEALNDLIVAYSEIEDGWKEARDYLLKKRDRKYMYKKLAQLAGLYQSQGKSREAMDVYAYFIDERPNHPKVPQWMESIIKEKKKVARLTKLEKTVNEYVAYLSRGGTWWKTNEQKGNDKALKNARLLKQATLTYLASKFHSRAQENELEKWYRKAATYYQKFIDRWPENPSSFDMNFFLAEIYLLKLKEYQKAAQHYQKVVDIYKNGNAPEKAKEKEIKSLVRDAAYGIVNAYDKLVKKHHPDSILVKMAEYQKKHGGEVLAEKKQEKGPPSEKDPNEKQELLKWEKKFVKASDQYSRMFPDTEVTPTVDFVAAEVYKARGHYSECIPRYKNIIENAPNHRYASFAGNSLLEANYVLERWDAVEKWARHLLENKIFDVTPKESLKSAIAYAINERSKDLKEKGKTKKAAAELLRLADEFPDSELAPGAVFNAAAIYESGDQVKKAVANYEKVLEKYPDSKQAPQAVFVLGLIAESRANFERAASYFEKFGTDRTYTVQKDKADGEGTKDVEKKFSDHEKAADAVFNAAELRKAMEQWGKAIANYQKYVELFPNRDDIRDVKLTIARLEEKRGKPEKALERYKAFLERDDVKKKEIIRLNKEIGLLQEKLQVDDWKKKSDERFTTAVETWKKLKDKKKKKKLRHAASHARFRQAERKYEKFKKVELTFPKSVLEKRLKKKGERLKEAEKIYFEINSMKSPKWAAASSYRIGKMYKEFSDAIYDLPIPKKVNGRELTDRQKQRYRMFLDQKAFPVQEKALKGFQRAVKLALELRAYNEWSEKSAEALAKLQNQAYPVTGQKGVAPTHGRMKFHPPAPLADFEQAVDRLRARKPKEPKEPKKPEQKPDEPKKDEGETPPAQASRPGS